MGSKSHQTKSYPSFLYMGLMFFLLSWQTRNGGMDVEFSKKVAHILYATQPQKLAQSLIIIDICGKEGESADQYYYIDTN